MRLPRCSMQARQVAPVLIVCVMEAGVAYARRCSWRSDRDPNGPRPLAGSVERSLGREIERDPPRRRGRPDRVCSKLNPIGGPMSAPVRSGSDLTGENVEKGQSLHFALQEKQRPFSASDHHEVGHRPAKR